LAFINTVWGVPFKQYFLSRYPLNSTSKVPSL
jgi:hypothetical protein